MNTMTSLCSLSVYFFVTSPGQADSLAVQNTGSLLAEVSHDDRELSKNRLYLL